MPPQNWRGAPARSEPIATRREVMIDRGVSFVVRVLLGDHDVRSARRTLNDKSAEPGGEARNPFLPYETDMFVADISPTHICLLNKFTVLDHHLLIVTRTFEPQEAALTQDDFVALWACMDEIDGLAFYNSGRVAGASQRHKHLQLVPGSLGVAGETVPIEHLLPASDLGEPVVLEDLPFRPVYCRHGLAHKPSRERALSTRDLCRRMLQVIGVWQDDEQTPAPYNWLMTRRWALAVPRSQEALAGISVNALGFAGCLLVLDVGQLEQLRTLGPLALLAAVAQPST